jgi:hypothetical protein
MLREAHQGASVTVRRLVDAVNASDITTVTSMLSTRPELVDLDVSEDDEHRALHHAVLQRRPATVRLLMPYGADARQGRPFGKHEPSDRERYVACFRMIIDRSGTDLPWRFGRTLQTRLESNS